ncbi:MAG: hypothetical protein AB9856_21160 [Cellulosilyticaceae bacterium]
MRKILLKPPVLASGLAACILVVVLIMIPVGVADNGDFYRVMSSGNLYGLEENKEDALFGYFIKDYGVRKYYNEINQDERLVTSQNVFIKLAVSLDKVFTGDDGLFDIRFLAVLQIAMCIFAIYLLVDYLSYNRSNLAGLIIGGLTVLIFVDTAYTAYFNSFFAEGIVYTSFLITMTSILLLQQKRYNPYFLIAVFTLNAGILISAKQQNAPLGILLGLLGIVLTLGNQTKGFKIIMRSIASGLIALGVLVYILIPKEFVNINQYHAMTRGMMMVGDNPQDVLQEFGIDEQYTLLKDSIYFERYPVVDVESPMLEENFYNRYGFVSISMHYLRHPKDFLKMMDLAAKNAYSVRPKVMGNYEKTMGKAPGERTKIFTLYSTIKERMTPNTVGFMMIWSILAILLGIKNRFRAIVIGCAILIGLSQIVVSIIGAGDADLAKHIFLYSVVFDFVNLIGISFLIAKLDEKLIRSEQ